MKAGVTVSVSRALGEFLASTEEPPIVPRQTIAESQSSKLWMHTTSIAEYCYGALNTLTACWQELPMLWAAVVSPQSFLWLSSERGQLTAVDLGLVLAHSALLVLITAMFTVVSCRSNDTLYLSTSAFLTSAMFYVTLSPLLLGGSVAWLVRVVKMKSEQYHVLIRRSLNVTRRANLQSIGAVSSYPLPPFTSVEENVDTLGSFATIPQLKFIRQCIAVGIAQTRRCMHSNSASRGTDVIMQSVKILGNEAHAILKVELRVYIDHLTTAKTLPDKSIPSSGSEILLHRIVHPFNVVRELVILSTSLYHCQYTLVNVLNDLGITTSALGSVCDSNAQSDGVSDKLFDDLSRILSSVNRLRMCHEWEAIRLWNCEFQLNEALLQLCSTYSTDDPQNKMEIVLAKVVAFLNGTPLPVAEDSESAKAVLSASSDLVSRYYPQKQAWEIINIQLVKVVNEYLVSSGGTAIHCDEALTPLEGVAAPLEVDPRMFNSVPAISSQKDPSGLDEYSCGVNQDHGPAPVRGPDPLVVDIFSAIVTLVDDKPTFKDEKEQRVSAGSKTAIGLMGELKQHMCARILNSGLLERENGGEAVPISIQDISTVPVKTHLAEDHSSDLVCNLTGNIATLSMLNSDLSAALKLREVGNSFTLSCGSSSSDDGDRSHTA